MLRNRTYTSLLVAAVAALLCLVPSGLRAQLGYLRAQVRNTPGASLTAFHNEAYGELHHLTWPVPLDHLHPERGLLQLRVFIGVCDTSAPVVLALDGYGIDYAQKPGYRNELAEILGANLVLVEHRFFGRSRPAVPDYSLLTLAQAAADVHVLRQLLHRQFSGSWISTGMSKGGHAALCHRMRHPEDVDATVVYGTAVKRTPMRQAGDLLAPLLATDCGRAVAAAQARLFQDSDSLWPVFQTFADAMGLDFRDMPTRLVWDFMRLEYPFSYFQIGNTDCKSVPHAPWNREQLVRHLLATVSPHSYEPATRKRWEPAYYMFYHELGYYEYDTTAWQRQLSVGNHGNRRFAPQGLDIAFDGQYLRDLSDYMDGPQAHTVMFVYGENDPWARWSAVDRNRYEVAGGGHGSRIADLEPGQRAALLRRLVGCLKR